MNNLAREQLKYKNRRMGNSHRNNNNTRLCKWCQSIVSLYYANIGKEDIITIILRITLPVMDNENEGMALSHNIVPLFVLFLKTFTFV